MKKIFFDLDGTVYDLYGVENWLKMLREENPEAYSIGKPIHDMDRLGNICMSLISYGWQIGVITWLSKFASNEYMEETTKIKREWVEQNMPYVSEFYALEYGTPKQYAPFKRAKEMILVDDNNEVLEMWKTETQRKIITANSELLVTLEILLENEEDIQNGKK